MRTTVIGAAAALFAGVAWAAEPAAYTLTVTTDRVVADVSAETAQAIGIPAETRTVTTVTFELTAADDGAYRLTFATASQQTLAAEATIPDVERVAALLPGRWVEIAPRTLAAGGIKRSPELTKDSEEVDYNLLAFMLFAPGGPLAAAWGDGSSSAVALSYGNAVVALVEARGEPLAAVEGQEGGGAEYSLAVSQRLNQQTKFSAMTGTATLEGVGRTVAAPDGLAAYARLELTGERKRVFTVFGKQHELVDSVSTSLALVRRGYELSPEDGGGEKPAP